MLLGMVKQSTRVVPSESRMQQSCFRTRRQPADVRRAVFVCLSDFVRKNFSGMKAPSHPDLALALETNNYELYAAYCAANR